MRAAASWAVALAACSSEVPPGPYLCGPQLLCPEGQVCNGPDNVCVPPDEAKQFECPAPEPTGDDDPATGTVLTDLACPSVTLDIGGCLGRYDVHDFYQLDVPSSCAAPRLEASVSFPVAFQPLDLLFAAGDAGPALVGTACPPSVPVPPGDDVRCFSQAVEPGGHYAIGVARVSRETCDGVCPFNRYRFRIGLVTP